MRALFVPAATAGHYFPMVPLAWALRTAGHEVCVACQPPVADLVVRSGHTAVTVGGSYDLMASVAEADRTIRGRLGRSPASFGELAVMDPELRKWQGGLRTAPHVRAAEAMAGDLVELARAWRPDVIVTDPVTMAAPLAAEVAGVPLVHHMWGPQEPTLTKFAGFGADPDRWPDDLRKLYDGFGADVRADYGLFSIAACPPGLQSGTVPRRHTFRYVPYNGSALLPPWLGGVGDGRPRVCVSWTTSRAVNPADGGHPVAAVAGALAAELDVEVVAAVTADDRRAGLGPVPDGVRIAAELPLHSVLPTCAVSVNTGGAGSVLTAAVNGVPQVVTPLGPAHSFNGERVTAAGAGVCLAPGGTDLDGLTASVSAMLSDDRWRRAAEELRRENLAQPPLTEAVRLLEEAL